MARLFGILAKSPIDLQLSYNPSPSISLTTHGWGIGWYESTGKIQTIKGVQSYINPKLNKPPSASVVSKIIILHTRRATSGEVAQKNCHPFFYKQQLFAHTGHVHKEMLYEGLQKPYNQNFQSEPIDSEVLFRLLIQAIDQGDPVEGIRSVIQLFPQHTKSSFLFTNGLSMYAYTIGNPLYFAFWNKQMVFENTSTETHINMVSKALSHTNALIFSSERFGTINWNVIDDGELVIGNPQLQYSIKKLIS